jgi:DNA-directed RNA polymerase subunit RPC12/RpoP
MSLAWQIEHACPQCGAPVTLEETNHLFACPYCRVKYYMFSEKAPRYVLPPPESYRDEIVFVPYWRFKGDIYSCLPYQIKNHILDTTIQAVDGPNLPISLGLRPQVLKLNFRLPDSPGRYLEPRVKLETALEEIQARLKTVDKLGDVPRPFHSTFFGETVSIIFTPFSKVEGRLYDPFRRSFIGPWPEFLDSLADSAADAAWGVTFVPAVCPHCGWDLDGHPNTFVLICKNCLTASESQAAGLQTLDYRLRHSDDPKAVYLPFWRMMVATQGLQLESMADFIRATNQPRVIKPDLENQPVYFWTPAFKVHATLFLRCCRNLIMAQPPVEFEAGPTPQSLMPVTLSATEAAQSLKISLANISLAKRGLFPELPNIDMTLVESLLVYYPFHNLGQELVNQDLQISINRKAMGLDEID